MADKNFIFNLPLAESMEQLVNNEYLSDVVFQVGDTAELIFGHKNILTRASEVFYAQFNGNFEEARQSSREHPIVVTDIDRSTFVEILRFMYCEKITLTMDNVLDVCYASKKYMLARLDAACEEFLRANINEENVMKIFNVNRRSEYDVVNKVCLDIICDNPLECFKHEDFFTLAKRSLDIITRCPKMNCQEEQLVDAAQNWFKINESRCGDGINFSSIVPKRESLELNCKKLRCYSNFDYRYSVVTRFYISVEETLFLYGLGIFVGVKDASCGITTIKLNILIEYSNHRISKVLTVPVSTELHIQEVLFEKLIINKNRRCLIKVQMEEVGNQMMFSLDSFNPVKSLGNISMTIQTLNGHSCNCVAHLLYNVDKSDLNN